MITRSEKDSFSFRRELMSRAAIYASSRALDSSSFARADRRVLKERTSVYLLGLTGSDVA